MSNVIGLFEKDCSDNYTGTIASLTVEREVQLSRIESNALDGKGPHYRVELAGHEGFEIGVGFVRFAKDGGEYMSVILDDPSFSAPVNAALFEGEQGYRLVWDRPRDK